MNGTSLIAHGHQFALTLPFTEPCWPLGPACDVYKVGGKMFMLTMPERARPLINLKARPEDILLHREIYPGIGPGYHMNKKHWISVYGGQDIHAELLESLIFASWNLVVDGLPVRTQRRLRPR